jgi:hypothetical protein
MRRRTFLSKTAAGRAWLGQFANTDQSAAAELLDAMLLLDAEQVASAQRSGLEELVAERRERRGCRDAKLPSTLNGRSPNMRCSYQRCFATELAKCASGP